MIIHNSNMVNAPQNASPAPAAREITIEVTRPESEALQDEEKVRGTGQDQDVDGARGTQDDEQRRLDALNRLEAQRENVIARSEDGDTLQVESRSADIKDEDIGDVVRMQGQMQPLQMTQEAPGAAEDEEDFEVTDLGRPGIVQEAAEESGDRNSEQTMSAVNEQTNRTQQTDQSRQEDQVQQADQAQQADETRQEDRAQQAEVAATATEAAEEAEDAARDARAAAEELRKAAEAEPAAKEEAQATAETLSATASRDAEQAFEVQESSNYIGISDDRLEQMYLKGEISRRDYEAEIEAREAAREQENEEQATFSKEMNGLESTQRRTEQNNDAIRSATSDNANDTLTAKQRLDIIEDIQDARSTEDNRKEEARKVWQSQYQG